MKTEAAVEEESSLLLAGHRTSTIFALAAGEMQGGAASALLEITRKGNDDAGRGSTKKKKKLKRWWVISTNSTKQELVEYPLRCSMELMELGARSIFFADLEFPELRRLARKIESGAIFLDLELLGTMPNTPLVA